LNELLIRERFLIGKPSLLQRRSAVAWRGWHADGEWCWRLRSRQYLS